MAGAGPVALSGLKDAFGRPLRSALAALSIVLAVVALIITLGLDRSVGRTVDDPARTGDPWDVTASVRGASIADVVAGIDATPGAAAWFFEQEERRVVDGEVLLVRAVGGETGAARYVIHEGRGMQQTGEALAGYGLLERLGKQVGDTVDLDIEGRRLPLTIVGRYGETDDSGEVLQIRWETLEPFFPGAQPETYRVVADESVPRSQLAADLAAQLGPEASVQALEVETEDLDAFGVAFMVVASLVLVVALANLGSTILLGVRERLRDFGVLRAIGFTPAQLVASTVVATLALTVVALVVGVPLGLWANDLLQRSVGEAIGYGPELATSPDWVLAAGAIAVIVVLALAIGALTCVRTAGRSASELIRYE
jgi:putative ABC transport system permease protein